MTPFLGTEALSAGTVQEPLLEQHRRLHRNVFLPPGSQVTATVRAKGAWLWSDRKGVVGGLSASALFGTRWIDADAPAELFRVNGKPRARHRRIHIETNCTADEICDVSGIAATTHPHERLRSGPTWEGLLRAVIRVDALAQQTGVTAEEIATLIPAIAVSRARPASRRGRADGWWRRIPAGDPARRWYSSRRGLPKPRTRDPGAPLPPRYGLRRIQGRRRV